MGAIEPQLSGDFPKRCLSAVAFWLPEFMGQSGWAEHAPFVFWLVEALRPRVFVELGTHNGYSYLAVCQAVQRLGLETRCYAIDTWEGDEHAGLYDETILADLKNYHDPRYSTFSRLVRSTFDDAVDHFEDATIDLLHVDGRHFYEDVKHDVTVWLSKVSPGGIILLHDINVRERDFGVQRFWNELKFKYPNFEFFHGHGLGVLAVGEFSSRLKCLFDSSLDPVAANEIRTIFGRLGRAITLEANSQQRERELARLRQSLTMSDAEIIDLRQSIIRRKEAMERRDAKAKRGIAKLIERLRSRDKEIATLRTSTSWKVTAPMRRIGQGLRSAIYRISKNTRRGR